MTNIRESHHVRVRRREALSADVVLLELEPVDGVLPPFEAGAHIDVHLPDSVRQYSLCGDPGQAGTYQIAVLRDPQSRGGSIAVHAIAEGEGLRIGAPRNHFSLTPAPFVVLIAGGIGLTPLLSMAHALTTQGVPFHLHYVVNRHSAAPFETRLARAGLAGEISIHRTDRAAGRAFDAAQILPPARDGAHLYVCGPTGFMQSVIASARSLGWPDEAIHKEDFGAEIDIAGDAFEVEARASGRVVRVGPDETIADALIAAGVDVPLSCEQGVCGTCMTRVIAGVVDHRDMYLSPAEQAANDVMAICCSRAVGGRLVLDI
ncbi:Phenoxybenzoate dioxygenase subunit beta [Brevundimonas sp. NIBR10]|uniref:PDR/VanB family oxidoreductase n=1 Tax=Brevundimonas sp. NIBR10 TaxID=3015997 RepID=UPI0022F1887E|nr:PDR/VanB family oxidoreductase [Brevundimonas sp. NIBR10]WGM45948.1 Phenoxybenzoate dioxygenase subunit beta [Brevundimonas sp. NIBR10]